MMTLEEWRRFVRHMVERVADEGFQTEAWFGKAGAQIVSSPLEVYLGLVDDALFGEFLTTEEAKLSNAQRDAGEELLREIESFFETHDAYADPGDVLDDPEWERVRSRARAFLQALR